MRSKKALYNVFLGLVLQLVIIVYGFIVPKIIINNFGSEVNGLISSVTQLLGYITLLESGFGPIVLAILYKPIAKKNKSEIENILKSSEQFFRKIALIFIIYIIFLSVFYPIFVKSGFSFLYISSLIGIISISTFAEYYFGMTYKLYIQAEQKQYVISFIQIISYILNVVIIVILTKINVSIHILKLFSGIAFAIRPLIQNYYVKKKYNINFDNADKKYKIDKKWDGLAQHIAFVIHTNTDVTILTLFASLSEVSIYSVYYLVVCGIKKIILSFASGIESIFGDMIAKNETDNLIKKFNMYEVIFNALSTVAFSSTIVLITPFIIVYTKGITDVNYIRYSFGYLLTISEFIWIIRQPYNLLIKSSGHFKETRNGAWVECISNILLSLILVIKYGLIGVALGTIVAMTIRTIEFIFHTNKFILNRSSIESFKKILLVIIETIVIIMICKYLPYVENINYLNWFINAIMVVCVAIIVTISLNITFFFKEIKEAFNILKIILKKRNNRFVKGENK